MGGVLKILLRTGSSCGLRRQFAFGFLLLAAGITISGCGGKKRVKLPPPTPVKVGWTQEGIASWYGHPYHGRRTSSGETYNMNRLTAAHLSIPFGTWVRVTNLRNKRHVDVRINDRGPFVKRRIIDISREAAKRIGMIGTGTARVRIQVVATPRMAYKPEEPQRKKEAALVRVDAPTPPMQGDSAANGFCPQSSLFGVQVGAFQVLENAERMREKMADHYGTAEIFPAQTANSVLYRVIAGRYSHLSAAEDLLKRLRRGGVDGFLTPIEGVEAEDCL